MKTIFEIGGKIIHEINEPLLPKKGTLIKIKNDLWEVDHCLIDLDKGLISVEIFNL